MTVQEEKGQQREQLPLTEFGTELYALLATHGVRTLAGLSRLLGEGGFSRQQLASYANGTRRVPTSFTRKVVDALQLDHEEETRLCRAVALGQPEERVKYKRERTS
jgi:hypothetical protein